MKKHILTVVLACCTFSVFSQSENQKVENKFRFGFNLGTNYSLLRSAETLPNNSEMYGGFGAVLGVFMEYSLTKHFLFSLYRPKKSLHFFM